MGTFPFCLLPDHILGAIETLYQYIDGNLRKDSLFLRLNTPNDLKFHYKFAESNKPLYVKVAISPVDTDGAERNMLAELRDGISMLHG